MNGDVEEGEEVYEQDWRPEPPRQRIRLNVVLFFLTAYTTTAAGMQMALGMQFALAPDRIPQDFDFLMALITPSYLWMGLPFSVSLLTILGIHEMGHYLAARRWRVRASLPYFIPFPPPSPIGTMGAVIKIKSRIPNRRALMDIGAAGPIAGFVVAVLALGIGLHYSTIVPNAEVSEGALQFGDSLLSGWMSDLILGPLPPGYDVYIHPVGFAGWLGLFVTVLNLLPMGQFDGGHIVYAIFGRKHRLISHSTLLLLALFWAFGPSYGWLDAAYPFQAWWDSRWPGWLVWIFMALILGRQHPPPSDPYTELDRPRMIVGCLSLVIFVLCFIPRPISIVGP